ncbi:MAG: alanine racemase [Gemmatimonadetes bacterium]|nr:alanine racemase [Gemmatimonadota bacterium]
MRLEELETPAAVVDLERVRANCSRVAGYCTEHGLAWRPHVKTHKSRRVARLQLEAGARGLTVATPREAEVMADVTDDLLLAYPPVGASKLSRVLALPAGVDLHVALDSPEAMDGLADAAAAAGRTVGVLVEVDVGMGRVGVADPDEAVALARRASRTAGVAYRGILFYPGHIRVEPSRQDEALAVLGRRLDTLVAALAAEGLAPGIVSGGSTPTLWRSHEIPHLTEIRPGTCVFFDREGVAMDVAEPGDLAYTILATVVSTAVPGQAVVDAGSKALAKEARGEGEGYGVLLDRPGVVVKGLSEEHGILDLTGTTWRPRVGERVRIVPNHVCVSANLQDALWALEGHDLERWEQEGRGRTPWTG